MIELVIMKHRYDNYMKLYRNGSALLDEIANLLKKECVTEREIDILERVYRETNEDMERWSNRMNELSTEMREMM